MKRRIFVAVGISKNLRDDVLSWEKSFSSLPVRWLEGKNLHITLVPPWYEEDIESVVRKLDTVKGEQFDMEFSHVTYAPNEREPRLIWAEGQAPERLIDFNGKLTALLSQKEETHPFRLHLTLARFRSENFSSFPVKELNEKVFWRDKVNSFVLMESLLSPKGADYNVLAEFPI